MSVGVATEIVERIATREGVDPVELEPPLYEVIDPDALDALVDGRRGRPDRSYVLVNFTYNGYAVTVSGGQDVTVEKRVPGGPTAEPSVDDEAVPD